MTEYMPSLCNDCVARNKCGKDDITMCASYTKEIKIRCDDCKHADDCVDYGWDGCRKFTPKPSEQMTNEEWFTSLTTEEKADVLTEIACEAYYDGLDEKLPLKHNCKHFMKWLKEKHK